METLIESVALLPDAFALASPLYSAYSEIVPAEDGVVKDKVARPEPSTFDVPMTDRSLRKKVTLPVGT